MDLDMPIKDGFETSKEIIELYEAEQKPIPAIIACTAYVGEESK